MDTTNRISMGKGVTDMIEMVDPHSWHEARRSRWVKIAQPHGPADDVFCCTIDLFSGLDRGGSRLGRETKCRSFSFSLLLMTLSKAFSSVPD